MNSYSFFGSMGTIAGRATKVGINTVKKIKSEFDEYDVISRLDPTKYNVDKVKEINGIEHYNFLITSIKKAKFRVMIFSGWISGNVIDKEFMNILEDAMKRGVDVYIAFGYKSYTTSESMEENTRKALDNISRTFYNPNNLQYKDKLHIYKFPNHTKILLVDDSYVVVGSANWLSNRRYVNKEHSVIYYSKKYTEDEAVRLIAMLEDYEEIKF